MWTQREKLAGNIGFFLGAAVLGVLSGAIAYAIGKDKGKGEIADGVKKAVEKGGKFKVGEVNIVDEVTKDSPEGQALDRNGYVVKVFLKGSETKFVGKKNKFSYSKDQEYYDGEPTPEKASAKA
jgi:hypothetical protein